MLTIQNKTTTICGTRIPIDSGLIVLSVSKEDNSLMVSCFSDLKTDKNEEGDWAKSFVLPCVNRYLSSSCCLSVSCLGSKISVFDRTDLI